MAQAQPAEVAALGLPQARAKTLIGLAQALTAGHITLAPKSQTSSEATLAALQQIRGIGPWTAQYLAMRALHDPDAFPAGDLGLRHALAIERAAAMIERAAAWRPFRAYAVMYLWTSLAEGGAA